MTSLAAPRVTTGSRRARPSVASVIRALGTARTPRRSLRAGTIPPVGNHVIAAMTLPRF